MEDNKLRELLNTAVEKASKESVEVPDMSAKIKVLAQAAPTYNKVEPIRSRQSFWKRSMAVAAAFVVGIGITLGGLFGAGILGGGSGDPIIALSTSFTSQSMFNTATNEQVVERLVVTGTRRSGNTTVLSPNEFTATTPLFQPLNNNEETFDFNVSLVANSQINTTASIPAVSVADYLIENMVTFLEGIADYVGIQTGDELLEDAEWGFLAQQYDVHTRLMLLRHVYEYNYYWERVYKYDNYGEPIYQLVGGIAILNNYEDAFELFDFVSQFPDRMYGFAYQNFFLSFGECIFDMTAFARMFNIPLRDDNLRLLFDVMDNPANYIEEFLVWDGLFNTELNLIDSWWFVDDVPPEMDHFGVVKRFNNWFISGDQPDGNTMGGIAITSTPEEALALLEATREQFGAGAGFGFAYQNIFASFSYARPWIMENFMALLFIMPDRPGVIML